MNAFSKRVWRILRKALVGASLAAFLFILLTPSAHALIDFNGNGVSDLWEMHYNSGELFTAFDPNGDPDGDGWTNAQEATAGTDPFDGNSPAGIVRPTIAHIPATYDDPNADGIPDILTPETAKVTWATLPGKLYTLLCSTDLSSASWTAVGDPFIGNGNIAGQTVVLTQQDGSSPDKLFFRVRIEDTDSDGDQLTDAEERALGTNTHSASPGSDVVTSTYDVYYTGSDPDDYDSSDEGTGSGQVAQIGSGDVPDSTYAPSFGWEENVRELYYNADEHTVGGQTTITGDLATTPDLGFISSTHSSLTARIPLASLSGMLPAFPESSYHLGLNSYSSESHIVPTTESVHLQQEQVRLTASAPVTAATTRHLMAAHWSAAGDDGTHSFSIESLSFTIPANMAVSPPQVLGTDFTPGGHQAVDTDCLFPVFGRGALLPGGGWDDTGEEFWQSAGVGETVSSRVNAQWGRFYGDITSRLEIVVASGSGSTAISLSDVSWDGNGCSFKIHGLLPTPDSGAQIVLRLKADPTVIFSTMRVHVFEKRTIPVTIFRVWDSRKGNSWADGGISNQDIQNALNNAFNKQANVYFHVTRTTRVDMAKNHNNLPWPFANVAPQYFTNDGSFDNSTGEIPTWDYTHSLPSMPIYANGPPVPTAKLTIHVVQGFLDPALGGEAFLPDSDHLPDYTFFIPQNATDNVIAHEGGHTLGLATKGVGNTGKHDHGDWPAEWNLHDKSRNQVGLMFDVAVPTMMQWIRREDWRAANLLAPALK